MSVCPSWHVSHSLGCLTSYMILRAFLALSVNYDLYSGRTSLHRVAYVPNRIHSTQSKKPTCDKRCIMQRAFNAVGLSRKARGAGKTRTCRGRACTKPLPPPSIRKIRATARARARAVGERPLSLRGSCLGLRVAEHDLRRILSFGVLRWLRGGFQDVQEWAAFHFFPGNIPFGQYEWSEASMMGVLARKVFGDL
jgi:hypothetical protein